MGIYEIREQIKLILSTATGAYDPDLTPGRVYDYQRWTTNWNEFLDLFLDDNDRINAWMITRETTPERILGLVSWNLRTPLWKITGVYGLNNGGASEIEFNDIINGICNKFRTEYNINDTCDTVVAEFGSMVGQYSIKPVVVNYTKFHEVTCHYCELLLSTQYREYRV